MPKIFLCYRREDNPFAVDMIDEALRTQFGREAIVRDIDTFPLGRDFRLVIAQEVNACDILVAVIGDRWLDMRHTEGPKSDQRRVDDPTDFVRLELETALERDIPVIPVLVDRAEMPSEADLPESLRALIYRGAAFVRAGRDRQTHITRLISGITALIEERTAEQANENQPVEMQPGPGQQPDIQVKPATWKNTIGIEFVLIPAGEFMIGSDDRDAGSDEQPVHKVTISQPFYLGKYEVTQGEWANLMGENPSYITGDSNLPVEQVSWDNVQEFIQKLNAQEGVTHYRLPTEAEWEYTARAGTTTVFHYGDTLDSTQANFDGNSPYRGASKGPYLERTTAVGHYQANAFGLYDMHGNVWEWVQDWYDEEYYKSSPARDPQGPASGASRVVRGGRWGFVAQFCRAAFRGGFAPAIRDGGLGFRLARSVALGP